LSTRLPLAAKRSQTTTSCGDKGHIKSVRFEAQCGLKNVLFSL
jgi:hypothetical protein